MYNAHKRLLEEERARKQSKMNSGHNASTLFFNLVASEVAGYMLGSRIPGPYKRTVGRVKNGLIKKAFKL